jgi:hypothetical protein
MWMDTMTPEDVKYWLNQQERSQQAAAASLAINYVLTDASGRDDDVPHIELIDQAIAHLQGAREALDLNRPNFSKADGHIENAGYALRQLEGMRA